MTFSVTGHAPCTHGARYVQQLVKHWSHKFVTNYAEGVGEVSFSDTERVQLKAQDEGIDILLTTGEATDSERMRGVIEAHLNRFAFREAPLSYHWNAISS